VPFNALLAEGILTRLREKTAASMEDSENLKSDVSEATQKRYQTQISWLAEGMPTLPPTAASFLLVLSSRSQ
jgi:hypothetical protein